MKPFRSILAILLAIIACGDTISLPSSLEIGTGSTTRLFKRKGGGGGGGRGGGGSISSSTSASSSRTPTSNNGGSSGAGSGSARGSYNGGQYYGGGASVPYRSGSTQRGIKPYLLAGAALGVFPGLWLYGAYAYPWSGNYRWRNSTSNQTETGLVTCLCGQYAVCGCDQNNNTDFLNSVANNASIAQKASNGTLFINGTLANGTTAPGSEGAAARLGQSLIPNIGYWLVVAGVTCAGLTL